ncbi:UNVERIFIED_CONTAM: ErmCL family antibiotic resistance leader peptide [Bacillus thuringiensis]
MFLRAHTIIILILKGGKNMGIFSILVINTVHYQLNIK